MSEYTIRERIGKLEAKLAFMQMIDSEGDAFAEDIVAENERLKKEHIKPDCTWTYLDDDWGAWKTSCGQEYCLQTGTPSECNMRYCAYCGGKLIQKLTKEADE